MKTCSHELRKYFIIITILIISYCPVKSNDLISKYNLLLDIFMTHSNPLLSELQLTDRYSKSTSSSNGDWVDEFAKELSNQLEYFLIKNANMSILDIPEAGDCFIDIAYTLLSNRSTLFEVINNSGKSLSDLGIEEECLKQNLAYYLMIYNINLSKFLYNNNTENYHVYKFLRQTNFFQGLCLWKNCTQLISEFLNPEKNQKFFTYLQSEVGINNLEHRRSHDESYPYEPETSQEYHVLIIMLWIIIAYCILKLLISIWGYNTLNASQIEEKKETNSEESSPNQSFLERRVTPIFGNNYQKQICNGNAPIKSRELEKLGYKSKWTYKVYKFCSLVKNLKTLARKKNRYYTEKGTELLSFIRLFLIFWQTYYFNMYALIIIPIRDLTNPSFYTSAWFSLVKYSIYASECWVALDGLLMAYKLMSYLKQHIDEQYSFWTFFKFYANILPKAVVLIIVFTFFNYFVEYYGYIFQAGPMFKYFIDTVINCRACKQNPSLMFIPFYLQYMSFHQKQRGLLNCFRYINIYTNELFCFTFVILLFYLSYRIKSKWFDCSIFFLFVVNLSLSFLSYDSFIGEYYTLVMFLGENSTLMYTHLLLNTYLIGVFAGMIYFYYYDVISTNPLETSGEYKPFNFCYALMKYLDQITKTMKKVLLVICILMQVLLSMSFYFYVLIFREKENQINVRINALITFFDMYEKKLFVLVFYFMIIVILLYPKDTTFRYFYDLNIFTPISRVSFSYFCSMDTIIFIFYCIFHFQLHLNFQNLLFMTLGIITLILIISVSLVILFELPIRMLLKKLKHDSRPKDQSFLNETT